MESRNSSGWLQGEGLVTRIRLGAEVESAGHETFLGASRAYFAESAHALWSQVPKDHPNNVLNFGGPNPITFVYIRPSWLGFGCSGLGAVGP